MVDLKKKLTSDATSGPVRGLAGQAAEVTGDVIELAELQVQLAKEDATDAMHASVRSLLIIAMGAVLLLASLPVLLLASAGIISRNFPISEEIAQLAVALLASSMALLAMTIAGGRLKQMRPFTRSSEELKQNVTYLKTIFRPSKS